MKLKNKLILIFIFFACFVIFNNNNCFADDTVTLTGFFGDTQTFPTYKNFLTSEKPLGVIFSGNGVFYLLVTSFQQYDYFDIDYSPFFRLSKSNTSFSSIVYPYSDVYRLINGSWVLYKSNYSATSSSSNMELYTLNINIFDYNFNLVYEYANLNFEPETTKHDLFQLNLTDKNFNNALHTFTLNTDENFVNYSELTDLIENNNKYCLYVTDYTRLLTFSDNSFNATLEGGSYLLSGYIDFLVSDNAYFYFSPHYNRIKVCSGDYRGQDMSTYTKRYFFNLVYSDDSDDTYFIILDDNGLLWSLSDYTNDGISSQSDYITDIQNSYFIGSNQTIYYANEDTNYILDSLTDSIYYGKDRGADERIYNFGFSGGNKKEFYLNEATFDNNVATQNQIITEKIPVVSSEETFEPVIIHDESNGNSSVIPQDTTTYTYPANTVTDETTSEEDATHRQNERTSFTSTDSNDDTSNWSLWDFIKGIFGKIGNLISSIGNLVTDLISGLVSLFVPSTDFFSDTFTDLGDWFEIKFGFLFYPFQFFLDVFDRITNIEFGEPVISIPDITEPFSDEIIIHAVEFNFNDLLENEGIETAHNFYLMFVDAILIIGFINLLKNKFEEVTHR